MDRKPNLLVSKPQSPKLNAKDRQHGWYPYYAGYSEGFVKDILTSLALSPGSIVLDPWNGSGTTTAVAQSMGFRSIGIDANPVLALVSGARAVRLTDASRLFELFSMKNSLVVPKFKPIKVLRTDPLLNYFTPNSVKIIRSAEKQLIDDTQQELIHSLNFQMKSVQPATALVYYLLFRILRESFGRSRNSNPTWTKRSNPKERASITWEFFLSEGRRVLINVFTHLSIRSHSSILPDIISADSTRNLPLEDKSVDAVVCSPPYLTRIDYVIAMSMEFALLGWDPHIQLRELRVKMLGAPLVGELNKVHPHNLEICRLIEEISNHSSKASSTYYSRFFYQYFSGFEESIKEVTRVTRTGGRAVFVVQSSHYKEIYLDLPFIVEQVLEEFGWTITDRYTYQLSASMAHLNPLSRKYIKCKRCEEVAIVATKKL